MAYRIRHVADNLENTQVDSVDKESECFFVRLGFWMLPFSLSGCVQKWRILRKDGDDDQPLDFGVPILGQTHVLYNVLSTFKVFVLSTSPKREAQMAELRPSLGLRSFNSDIHVPTLHGPVRKSTHHSIIFLISTRKRSFFPAPGTVLQTSRTLHTFGDSEGTAAKASGHGTDPRGRVAEPAGGPFGTRSLAPGR